MLVRPNAFTKVYLNLTVREKICTKKCALTVEDKTSEAVHEAMCPNDGFVYFRNSELLSGQVGKKTLGENIYKLILISSSMIHLMNHFLGLEG